MGTLTARFRRGAPITVARRVKSGDPAGYTFTAALKKTVGEVMPKATAPVDAVFSTVFVPAAGSEAAYWSITLSAAQSAALKPGTYVVDGKFVFNGVTVAIVEPIFITLFETVTG